MDYVLKGLEPEKCFRYFEEISRIPRSSFEEQAAAKYVMDFAAARNLKAYEDAAHNVYVSKPATPGYENKKPVMLQAHMDMVCVSDPGVVHDFSKDPIELVIDGDWITANGTTLGADNGSGCCLMLALLDSDDVEHPAIQCLFTTAEEVGLVGACQLEPARFEADYLINLDGGGMEKLLTSSAGCAVHVYKIPEERTPVCAEGKTALKLAIGGLTSGHSGSLAHVGYANAIKLIGEMLASLAEKVPYALAAFTGGSKMNAIAKEAEAVIVLDADQDAAARAHLDRTAACIKKEFSRTDPDMTIDVTDTVVPADSFGAEAQKKLVAFIDLLFDGAYMFYNDAKSMAKTSCNIGILESIDDVTVGTCLMRSNSNYEMDELIRRSIRITDLLGVEHIVKDRAGAWEGDGTKLILKAADLYEELHGTRPEFMQAHGGVEIGTILGLGASVGREMYAVNFGLKAEGAHTTKERLYIPGVKSGWEWLQEFLKNLD